MTIFKAIKELFIKEASVCDRCGFVAYDESRLRQHKTKKRKNDCPLHRYKKINGYI